MNEKGNCQKCNQRIQNTIYDKCMFCGTDLPPEQQFTELEKSQIAERQKQEERDTISKSVQGSNSSTGNTLGDIDGFDGFCD